MAQYVLALLAALTVGTSSQSNSWVRNDGLNCYANHGAVDLESPPGSSCGVMSLNDCQTKCQATLGCTAVTVLADESSHTAPDGTHVLADASGKFQCYRRSNLTIPNCDAGSSYVTYAAGQWAHAASVNCYSGKGATDLESPPGSNCGTMSLAACQAKCQAMEGCDGITVQPAAGGDHCCTYLDPVTLHMALYFCICSLEQCRCLPCSAQQQQCTTVQSQQLCTTHNSSSAPLHHCTITAAVQHYMVGECVVQGW